MCNGFKDDGLDDLLGEGTIADADAEFALKYLQKTAVHEPNRAAVYKEPCDKCNGRSKFYSYYGNLVGDCFTCKGTGFRSFKTSPEARAKARQSADARKVRAAQEAADNASAWKEANPEAAAWLVSAAGRGFEFAQSLLEALHKYGHLTEKQAAAAERAAEKAEEREKQWAAERAEREASKPAVDVDVVKGALENAKGNGLKYPKIRLAGFIFSLAGAASRNAGAVYVKDAYDTYLGKIVEGRLTRSRDCDAQLAEAIAAAAADPEKAAKAYGLQTGVCSCCGRELTNPDSIARGIGPICADKFGWAF
jgi:hypothetical protein